MDNSNFKLATLNSFENGERLLEDAQELLDYEKYPSAFALSIIAQEEFSKSFIFQLVLKNILPWHPFVKRAIQDHSSKQLIGLVLDHLSPKVDDFLNNSENDSWHDDSYKKAIDAINLLRFEKFEKWESNNAIYDGKLNVHKDAINILKGKLDKEKQDSLYVRVDKNGHVVFNPLQIKKADTERMIERAERFSTIIRILIKNDNFNYFDYKSIENSFVILFDKFNSI